MTRQTSQLDSITSTNETRSEIRHRMIRETETFLNERLYRRDGDWATDERVSIMLKPYQDLADRRQAPLRTEGGHDIRLRPDWSTLIEVHPNERGIVDDPRLQTLEVQLDRLTADRTAGHILVGVHDVAVMTAGLMSLLAIFRPRLACQRRRLSLHGLRPECVDVLRGTGLEGLL